MPTVTCLYASEYGETWHKAGMLANKQTVFSDFQCAAEYLVDHKYTSPSQYVNSLYSTILQTYVYLIYLR